jgi:iron complex transport system substrate-binding protein
MIRSLSAATALLLVLVSLAACADSEEPGPAAPAEAGAFPVTIEHKYGTTEIERAPKRVVTVGLNEQDAFMALGTVPVGVTDWMGFEKIAALRPDLIVALYSDLKKPDYEKLSQIAPVVAPPSGHADFGIPYEETTRTVGRILGKSEEAKELVGDVDATYAKARAEHPEFAGKSITMAMPYEGIWVYGPDDPRSRMLTELGFELSPTISRLFVKDYAGKLSDERVDLLDLDAVVWVGADADVAKLRRNRLYTSLAVHREGRDVFIGDGRDDRAFDAIGFQTVLSIPRALDVLVPALAEAVEDSSP